MNECFYLRGDTLVKRTSDKNMDGSTSAIDDEWCTTQELDTLFDVCARKWGANWDLNKVCVAIRESDIL